MKFITFAATLLFSINAVASDHVWKQDSTNLDILVVKPVLKSSGVNDIDYIDRVKLRTRNMITVTEFEIDHEHGNNWCGEPSSRNSNEPFATALVDGSKAKLNLVCSSKYDPSADTHKWTSIKLTPADQFSVDLFNMQYSSYKDFDFEIERNSKPGEAVIYQIKGDGLEKSMRALFERLLNAS